MGSAFIVNRRRWEGSACGLGLASFPFPAGANGGSTWAFLLDCSGCVTEKEGVVGLKYQTSKMGFD